MKPVRSSLTLKSLWPGYSIAFFIIFILGLALISLCYFALTKGNVTLYFDGYLFYVIVITFLQAILSTTISIVVAIIMAKALSMLDFYGKAWLVKLLPVSFILPALVVVIGMLAIYGQQGLIKSLFQAMGIRYSLSIYGLSGILLAHVFLNFPYACRAFYQTLMMIPNEHKQLAIQLNFSAWDYVKIIEWPLLRRQLGQLSSLIFMLCFSSFAIVLALGGGPKYTTISVAIYQSFRDFDLLQAVTFAIIQLIFCLAFMWISQQFDSTKKLHVQLRKPIYRLPFSKPVKFIYGIIILMGTAFVFLPILCVLIEGLANFKLAQINASFTQALFYSFIIALGSALLALLMSCLMLSTNSQLLIHHAKSASHRLMLIGSLILAIPSMVLAAGFFVLFVEYADNPYIVCILLVICNALMALPFMLKNLENPIYDVNKNYLKLSQLLNITGLKHFYLIEYKALKSLLFRSFAIAMILSLGDFGIIALFGGDTVITLPYYLYEQLAHYRYQEATFTASCLLILALILMFIIDYD